MLHKLALATNRLLGRLGYEIRRKRPPRATLEQALSNARQSGLEAATVFDVGVANGTPALYNAFPNSHHILVEPLAEYESRLQELAQSLERADYVLGAAGAAAGTATLNVHNDLVGSSLYLEHENSDVNGTPRQVRICTLDGLRSQLDVKPPCLIKADVQGAELDVLEGARELLAETSCIVLEASFFQFFEHGPIANEVIRHMRQKDFALYDIVDLGYRPIDGALAYCDLVFVRQDGPLRKDHVYATREQRLASDRSFRRAA